MTAHVVTAHGHGSKRSLVIGSALSILLTAIPFWLVMTGVLSSPGATITTIFAFALVQIVVHVVCFLHVDAKSEGGWTLLSFLFTAIIVVITIVGSVWVMYHMDANMMPT
ncbi:cytochrome o ubiquinol oxidase subunit IV [Luteibacter aegosomatissinici]|uniref:cytochrome o ubiquinol oxidase subunit IV n=1 Tax=Luteibacter aegosomatissinici TaxID=2911539 RepID=UPI001FFB3020|nr:cytochrome o ubiquinol oxidase subunit IV [Luteibacter aegosomatissinici]UPG94578.1 cytochrome o ubiquinol oxidase subunit IV [Luteibacter aegosomatissinici]